MKVDWVFVKPSSMDCLVKFKQINFFNVGPPKEDIFPGHLLSPIFQIIITHYILQVLCLFVEAALVSSSTIQVNAIGAQSLRSCLRKR